MEISHNHLLAKPSSPHNYAYRKMECIIKDMQHPETGVPVKSQKLFLTTISNAFTGAELIAWMSNRLDMNNEEALHLATLLCRYGYYFHVTLAGTHQVKDDSELYRFQAPYYWLSTNWNAGNTDYAIYLVKRTMRNQEKHALSDSENHALNDLKKKLTHQWDFIRMQADAQIRVLKDRKKSDKTFIDSQEKAFWNILRPQTEVVSILEEDMRTTLLSRESKNSKKDEFIKKKILFFQQSIQNRVRTKSSQTLQGLCAYSEVYYEYDAMFGNCLPSNPWISDDTSLWEMNVPLVDQSQLTQQRVKRWSFSFPELLSDPTGVREFMQFSETEFSTESLKFYLGCQAIKRTATSELPVLINKYYKEHLSPDGGAEVNVNDGIRNKITKSLESPSRDIFYEAEKHIYELMKKNSYPRFLLSEQYKKLLENAIIPMPKKSGPFQFVSTDYFRHVDTHMSSNDVTSADDEVTDGIFVAGGIYAPVTKSIADAASSLSSSIAHAAGILKHALVYPIQENEKEVEE